jgi:Spaetzle
LIRNQTLKFLSRTLPILKADDTLPKVTQVVENDLIDGANQRTYDEDENSHELTDDYEPEMTEKRSRQKRQVDLNRNTRKFCDGGGVFCALYRAIQGEPISSQLIAERREETVPLTTQYQGPPTPCPAKVEYVTPVFAKNFQGSWRYVVQIPYEGYFTQTVEVTRCLQTKCHYLGKVSL